ncbi:hypothetical protein AKKGGB_AKKGGB_12845, partial [Dysosmobacter welbionis]
SCRGEPGRPSQKPLPGRSRPTAPGPGSPGPAAECRARTPPPAAIFHREWHPAALCKHTT